MNYRNFYRLGTGIDVQPVLFQLYRLPHLWDQTTFRKDFPDSPMAQISDLILRWQTSESPDPRECVDWDVYAQLPQVRPIVFGLMAVVQGERLGRLCISRTPPGAVIGRHSDVGDTPYHQEQERYYDRFHVCLQADEGSIFICGDEAITMQTGEAFWFANWIEHEVRNTGKIDRIHLVVDIKCSLFH